MASSDELELARARAKAKLRLRQQAAAQPEPEPAEPELGALDTARGAIESFNQGTTLGFGDEISALGRAGLDYVMDAAIDNPLDDGESQSFGDRYRMYRDDQRGVQEQFADENAKTAMALELAGGLASPINVVGPGLQTAKNVGALKTAGTVGLRGAAEGAIAGAGTADELEDVGSGALTGAGIGGALGGTMGGLGRTLSRRRIAQDVMKKGAEGADKVPIHMIDPTNNTEQALASGYRNVLGRMPFSKGVLQAQEEGVLKAAREAADESLDTLTTRKAARDLGEVRLKVNSQRALKRATQEIDDEIAQAQARMRSQQAARSLPDYVPAEQRAAIADMGDPQQTLAELQKFWGKDGPAFQSVKQADIEVDQRLANMLKKQFPDGLNGVDDIDDLVGETISGKTLMEFRNNPARAAKPDADGFAYGKNRLDVAEYDKQILRLLPDRESRKAFKADKAAWGDFRAYQEAVEKADKLDGMFTGDHLASTGAKRYRRVNEGKGQVLGKPVRRLEKSAAARKKAAKEAIEAPTKDPIRKADFKKGQRAIDDEMAAVREGLAEVNARGISQNVTFPSQLATASGVGAAAATLPFFGYGAVVPTALAASRGLVSEGGQRTIAGQNWWQKLLQDDERARLMAQMLRQSTSRMAAGD